MKIILISTKAKNKKNNDNENDILRSLYKSFTCKNIICCIYSIYFNSEIKFKGINFLYSIFNSVILGLMCKIKKIDLIIEFELDNTINFKIIKYISKRTRLSMWCGVYENLLWSEIILKLNLCDYIWQPAIFNKKINSRLNNNILRYVGIAVDNEIYYYDYDEKYSYDIVFYGGISKGHTDRIETLEKIALNFDSFVFFGYGIENLPQNSILLNNFKGMANQIELRKIISSSKIVINLTLDNYVENVSRGFNFRLLEIAACKGAAQVIKYDEKIREFLNIDNDLYTFTDTNDIVKNIKLCLSNEKLRAEKVDKAFISSLKSSYELMADRIIYFYNESSI